jgi:signal transduction histidine kinase
MYTGFLRHSAAQGAGIDVAVQTAGKIDLAVDSIHRQINRLLELATLESGAVALNTQWVDLGAVFGRAEELFAGHAKAKGIRLQFAGLSSRRYQIVETDAHMLESILENLISNAVKHTEHGAVYVGTRLRHGFPTGQQLCIEVRDSGVGIAAELLPLVFDAYRSFDDRKSSESHGLGLAKARAQASYLGCEITAVSKPGQGSTFTLCGLRFKA